MNKLIALLLLLLAPVAHAALPVPPAAGSIPSRTSCTAPCAVFFDASGTTDADLPDSGANANRAFRGLAYQWSFGDASAGAWSYGANTALSKNLATGAVAAHVYETAGSYTWTLVVCDSTTTCASPVSGTITVAAASTTFSAANTTCINASGSDHTGCPLIPGTYADSAACVSAGRCVTQSVWNTGYTSHAGSGKAVYWKRGDTFTRSAAITVGDVDTMLLGVYGSGAKPIITGTNTGWLTFNNTSATDIMVADFDVRGADGATDTGVMVNMTGTTTHLLLLRLVIQEVGKPIVSNVDSAAAWTNSIIQDCELKNWGANGGNGIYLGYGSGIAILGNSVGPIDPLATAGFPEHGIRVQWARKAVVSSNYVFGVAASKVNLTIRANTFVTTADDTQYVYVSDNKLVSNLNATALSVGPNASNIHSDIYDLVFERNWIVAESTTLDQETVVGLTAARVEFRNNLIDMGSLDSSNAIKVSYGATEIAAGTILSSNLVFYHNTIYGGASTASNPIGITIDADASAVTVMNNLMYSTTGGDAVFRSGAGASPGTQTPNSTDAQARSTSPSFADAASPPAGFRPTVTSGYPVDTGTAVFPASASDFYRCSQTSGTRYGAFVPRALAQCRGVAGP